MSLNYSILEQTVEQLRETLNSPSVAMWPYPVDSAQTSLIKTISVYMETGENVRPSAGTLHECNCTQDLALDG